MTRKTTSRSKALSRFALVAVLMTSCSTNRQRGDATYVPQAPLQAERSGIRVALDEAHVNFHTLEGRYAAFGTELAAGGYQVAAFRDSFDADSLRTTQVLVIANALHESNRASWTTPTPSAFTEQEIAAVESWIRDGGRLLLIADHMPFPGAAADLAAALGFRFHNGFAFASDRENGNFVLTAADGLLNVDPLGRFAPESLRSDAVKVFTGQAFEILGDAEAVLLAPPGTRQLLPSEAWDFDDDTPSVPSDGFAIAAVGLLGRGRVAVFGEAAMLTSQLVERDGQLFRTGLADPAATGNATLLHAVLGWLSEGLEPR